MVGYPTTIWVIYNSEKFPHQVYYDIYDLTLVFQLGIPITLSKNKQKNQSYYMEGLLDLFSLF
jgi:hypothetical protein